MQKLSVVGDKTAQLTTYNGNVGIGTTLPGQKLQVNGNIEYSGQLSRSGGTKPFARYNTFPAATTTGPARLNFTTKVYDTHNAVTTGASWKFKVPSKCAGYYLVHIGTHFQGSGYCDLYRTTGGVTTQHCRLNQSPSQYLHHGSAMIYLLATDEIYVNITAGTVDAAGYLNYIDIACLDLQ
jgi:hypothetical protein